MSAVAPASGLPKVPIPTNYALTHTYTLTTTEHGAKKTKIKPLEQGPFSPRPSGKPCNRGLYSRAHCYHYRDCGFNFDQCCCKQSVLETAMSRGRDGEVYSKLNPTS